MHSDVRTLITHASCPDGLASALVVRDAYPGVQVMFLQYDTPEHQALVPEPGTVFCDFTPWVEREQAARLSVLDSWLPGKSGRPMTDRGRAQAQSWVNAGATVLDHHAGVDDIVALFGERGVYSDEPGVSGASLAHRVLWAPLAGSSTELRSMVARFVHLAGVRDTWQRQSADWKAACEQAAVLSFYSTEVLLREGLRKACERASSEIGEIIVQQQAEGDLKRLREAHFFFAHVPSYLRDDLSAHGVKAEHVRVACFNGDSRAASDVAELLNDEVDMVIAWRYFVRRGEAYMALSSRGRSNFRCLPFVQWLGGNGHDYAAGCAIKLSDNVAWSRDPYAVIEHAVQSFLHS